MTRLRLGVEGQGGKRELNLRALFAAFDVPWDGERSREIFERTMARLEERDREDGRDAE